MASLKFMGKHPDSSSTSKVRVKWLSGLVPGSAKLTFPATQIMEDTSLVANSKRMELTSPRMDRSVAKRHVENVDNKSLESTTIHSLTSVPSSSSNAFANTFPSFIASPAPSISADVTDLTSRCDL